jgi:hypothetical protein
MNSPSTVVAWVTTLEEATGQRQRDFPLWCVGTGRNPIPTDPRADPPHHHQGTGYHWKGWTPGGQSPGSAKRCARYLASHHADRRGLGLAVRYPGGCAGTQGRGDANVGSGSTPPQSGFSRAHSRRPGRRKGLCVSRMPRTHGDYGTNHG